MVRHDISRSDTSPSSPKRLAVAITAALLTATIPSVRAETLYEKDSLYHYILVEEHDSVRLMYFRRSGSEYKESALDLKDPLRFRMDYYPMMFAAFLFTPEPKQMLMVGLGGGTLPMAIRRYFPEAQLDIVELDPEVLSVAKTYFDFREDEKMKVYVRDGRLQLKHFAKQKRQYDIIWLDAFRGGYIPFHLTTQEFYELCEQLLARSGTLVSNLHADSRLYDYQRRTIAAVFAAQHMFKRTGNAIVVSRRKELRPSTDELSARASSLQTQREIKFDLAQVAASRRDRPDYRTNGKILTDDYAPANLLRGIPRE